MERQFDPLPQMKRCPKEGRHTYMGQWQYDLGVGKTLFYRCIHEFITTKVCIQLLGSYWHLNTLLPFVLVLVLISVFFKLCYLWALYHQGAK